MEPLTHILKRYWGYDTFRPMQREIIESVLAGHDTLGLMPTGGGKSLTFQVPGIALGGLTLVITPLVALMKDQVDNLRSHGIKAAFLHSGMTYAETSRVWQLLVHGGCRFLYISPERLQNERFCRELQALKRIRLVVVDEAHCISQWGYDFRPSYLGIAKLRKLLPPMPFMALTASATPAVARDICSVLGFQDGRTFSTPFSRPNISYVVRNISAKVQHIVHILSRVPGTSIVYVRSRRRTVEIAKALCEAGVEAAPFHAGLDYAVKEARINAWKDGSLRVMVATNAFGMGIDKPDVRTVIHHDVPPSMEEYYQEAGRAGRDGKQAYAVLLADKFDYARLRRRVTESFPPRETIERVYELLCNFLGLAIGEGYDRLYEFNFGKFIETFRLPEVQTRAAIDILAAAGYLEYIDETENASRTMILVSREELYDMPAAGPHADAVMRALLRNCPGIFADYVYFSESRIATDAGCTPQDVYDTLITLSREGVLNYVPRKRTTYIYIPTSRELPEQLLIPRTVYQERREQMRRRAESMIDYASHQWQCRQQLILDYFGQEGSKACGTCDVCRAARNQYTPARGRELERSLSEMLINHPEGLTLPAILAQYGAYADRAAAILAYQADEGIVRINEGRYTVVT